MRNRLYPAPLMDEYQDLINKRLHRVISQSELLRLQEIRNEIAAIDTQRPKPDIFDIQRGKQKQELAEIRAEVESLPNLS